MKYLILAFAALFCSFQAEATDLVTEPQSELYVAPVIYNGRFISVIGDTSSLTPTWYLAQWNNPIPITTSLFSPPGLSWLAGDSSTAVRFYAKPDIQNGIPQHAYELSQNGNAPDNLLPCGTEYDLLLGTNPGNAGVYTTPTGSTAPSTFAQSEPLNNLTSISFKFGLNVAFEANQGRCSLNYSAYDAAVVLKDTAGGQNLTLFWQIEFRDFRIGETGANLPCPGYGTGGNYCYTSTIDAISNLSQQIVGTGRVQYNVNFLRYLRQAIALTSDPNSANWSVTGAYVGSLINGGMSITSFWGGVTLTAY